MGGNIFTRSIVKVKNKAMILNRAWFIVVAFYLTLLVVVHCAIITPREMDIRRSQALDPKKRPFCNAFTGCGKKRSSNGDSISQKNSENALMGGQEEMPDENTLSDLIDLNSEPAVDDLMRQIMSQAKLWEALQEASREIYSQKHHIDTQPRYPLSFSTQ